MLKFSKNFRVIRNESTVNQAVCSVKKRLVFITIASRPIAFFLYTLVITTIGSLGVHIQVQYTSTTACRCIYGLLWFITCTIAKAIRVLSRCLSRTHGLSNGSSILFTFIFQTFFGSILFFHYVVRSL